MKEVPESFVQAASRNWLRAVAGLVTTQWEWLGAQWQAGLSTMAAALGVPGGVPKEAAPAPRGEQVPVSARTGNPEAPKEAPPGPRGEPQNLERRALERVSQGLPPPPEAYASPARERIDWSRFPVWARPSDPELFEGQHEG